MPAAGPTNAMYIIFYFYSGIPIDKLHLPCTLLYIDNWKEGDCMEVEFDGKFTVGYKTSGGEESAVRVLPEAGRLFAAAPDLLKECKAATKAYEILKLILDVDEIHRYLPGLEGCQADLEKAIAKAESK